MIINSKDLAGLLVETKSGLVLGKIKSFEIDSETQSVLRYIVKSRNLISKLLSKEANELIISRNQVVSIKGEKMIVEDGVVKEAKTVKVLHGARENASLLQAE